MHYKKGIQQMNKAKLREKMKLEKWENSFLEINKKKRRNIERL